jgi:hypothetical protein
MQKKKIMNIVMWSTAALLVPFVGNMFVDGWNWSAHDFLFAWVFFILLGLAFTFVTHKVSNPTYKKLAGLVVVAAFAAVWVMLATG